MSWTEENAQRCKELWAEGHSASQIAGILGGFTRNAVISKIHRMGLTGKHKKFKSKTSGHYTVKPTSYKPVSPVKQLREPVRETRISPHVAKLPASEGTVEPTQRGLSLLELENHHCRFPLSDNPFTFCGADKVEGSSYCEKHTEICWVKPHRKPMHFRLQKMARAA